MLSDFNPVASSTPGFAARGILTVAQILAWADAHLAAHGSWPDEGLWRQSVPVDGVPGECWVAVERALGRGERGLPGHSSLSALLAEHRGASLPNPWLCALGERVWNWQKRWCSTPLPLLRTRRSRLRNQVLNVATILTWADAHFVVTGRWPGAGSGRVRAAHVWITWAIIDLRLRTGTMIDAKRPTTLSELLAERRESVSALSLEQVLAWADAHREATGQWPTSKTGNVLGVPGYTWKQVEAFLKAGERGLPGGLTIRRMLAIHRKRAPKPPRARKPQLSVAKILAWAFAHHAAKGKWPTYRSGRVHYTRDRIKWFAIDRFLRSGQRGLPGGTTLSKLLAAHRKPKVRKPLTVEAILAWADAHHAATDRWPSGKTGVVVGAPIPLKWAQINEALRLGRRGLPAGSSLSKLLAERRESSKARTLSVAAILAWADAHHAATGKWPVHTSGVVRHAPSRETWGAINSSLDRGRRGLPGGTSLSQLLADRRKNTPPPALGLEQVRAWAVAHHATHGKWPTQKSGKVEGAPSESWWKIDNYLKTGKRGLPAGLSLRSLRQ